MAVGGAPTRLRAAGRRLADHARRGDALNAARRHVAMWADQAWAVAGKRLRHPPVPPFDGDPRLALLTVTCSTTRYLKLMLLTLAEQSGLGLVERVVVVDNDSRDGGRPFLRELARRVDRLVLVEHRHFASHARGMRAAVRALDRAEAGAAPDARANLLCFVDPDVIFRNPDTLLDLASVVVAHDAALVGELRRFHEKPDVQASFFVVRRDVYARRDVAPPVSHGSPAYWMQRDIWDAGLTVVDFPSNHGGYVLHRGRSAVAAVHDLRPRHPYATADRRAPHFMGVPDGAAIWAAVEERHAGLLDPSAEPRLLDHLAEHLGGLGAPPTDVDA